MLLPSLIFLLKEAHAAGVPREATGGQIPTILVQNYIITKIFLVIKGDKIYVGSISH